jgi:transposase
LGARAKARAEKRAQQQEAAGEQDPDGEGASDDGPADQGGAAVKRKQGGQRGHRGSGLARVSDPQHTKPVEPTACGGCGGDLAGAPGDVGYSVQVFDLPAFSLEVTDYLMMRRVCGCGRPTTADAPSQVRGGPTCYGPQVAAASAWLASQDVIGIERAADMMAALLGAPVSTGFVSSCLTRLDAALVGAGFEEELKAALREQDVLGTDETPAPLTATGAAAEKDEDCSNPQVFTVRTLRAYTRGWAGDPEDLAGDLVWYGAAGTRTKKAITAFGILETFCGVLVRDDFGGYISYDKQLAGVQQCLSHLLRYLDDAYDIDPGTQRWAHQVADALRGAIHAINTARRNGTSLDLAVIARARRSYDKGVAVGISTNLSRPWHKGNHPGLVLAKRLQRKVEQVWLFTTRPGDVPPTNDEASYCTFSSRVAWFRGGCRLVGVVVGLIMARATDSRGGACQWTRSFPCGGQLISVLADSSSLCPRSARAPGRHPRAIRRVAASRPVTSSASSTRTASAGSQRCARAAAAAAGSPPRPGPRSRAAGAVLPVTASPAEGGLMNWNLLHQNCSSHSSVDRLGVGGGHSATRRPPASPAWPVVVASFRCRLGPPWCWRGVSSGTPARRRRQAAVRQAGEQNRAGEPTSGLVNNPSTAVIVNPPQQAQVNPRRLGVGEASRIRAGLASVAEPAPVLELALPVLGLAPVLELAPIRLEHVARE